MNTQATHRSDTREEQTDDKIFDLDEIDADHRKMWAEIPAIQNALGDEEHG